MSDKKEARGRKPLPDGEKKIKKSICLAPEIWNALEVVAKVDYPNRKHPPISPTIETLIRNTFYRGQEAGL